uniref:Uncharacterized protein n=1 Tax=Panagrolaimus sp. PS1159 TaxID=55785 RepID=A0AC35EXR0_9BILA
MHPLKKIKILKSTSTNIRSFLQWDDNGLVTVIIPNKRSVLQYIKNPVICKDDRVLCLKRGSSNWILTLTYHKVILISINITMENTYYDNKFTTTIVKIKHENELTVEAPLLILKGLTNIAPTLNLISETSLFIYGNITCDNLSLKAPKNIRLNNEAIIQCKTFSTISLKFFHYGSICNLKDDKILNLNIKAEICHINMEGRIGIRHKLYHPNEICTTVIKGSINASLRNFGNIKAISEISLKVKEILSLKDNHEDTAQRLLTPVKSPSMSSLATLSPLSMSSPRAHNSQNISISTSTILPSIQLPMSPTPLSKPQTSYCVSKNSSSLSLNIQTKTNLLLSSQNYNNSYLTTSMVALSPPTSTSTNMSAPPSPLLTPKKIHSPITNPPKSSSSHTSSTSPFPLKDQRIRGLIKAENINLNIEKSMEDMAQLIGENVTLKVGNECICEELSECFANSFVIKSCKNVAIFGHVKFNVAKMIAINKILIAKFGYFETTNELSIFVGDFTKRTKNAGMIIKGLDF